MLDYLNFSPDNRKAVNRLIIVSNRIGCIERSTQTGGLAVAIADALRDHEGIWFGTAEQGSTGGTSQAANGNVAYVKVPLSDREYETYYQGYSNGLLWPLFHHRTDLIEYQEHEYQGYLGVNRRLAAKLAPLLQDGDLVWVHDYHLLPFARQLRRLGHERRKIGFFLHIPFPPPEILSASPNQKALLEALLDYDVVGFQTSTHLQNFRDSVAKLGLAQPIAGKYILTAQRRVRCDVYPIAIDFDCFREMACSEHWDVQINELRRQILKRKQIVGVDRLDYSKGIPARFEAFAKVLETHPELERRVSLLQISPPTREGIKAYDEIRRETEGLAGSINGRFCDLNWMPIHYIHRSFARDRLAAILRASDVGLVTPLQDGMNLVAKEFVAAQDSEDPGVLVLSCFAGACEEMPDALIVNPHDTDEMARNIARALSMPREERKERHASLVESVSSTSARSWADSFLRDLEECDHHDERPHRVAVMQDLSQGVHTGT